VSLCSKKKTKEESASKNRAEEKKKSPVVIKKKGKKMNAGFVGGEETLMKKCSVAGVKQRNEEKKCQKRKEITCVCVCVLLALSQMLSLVCPPQSSLSVPK